MCHGHGPLVRFVPLSLLYLYISTTPGHCARHLWLSPGYDLLLSSSHHLTTSSQQRCLPLGPADGSANQRAPTLFPCSVALPWACVIQNLKGICIQQVGLSLLLPGLCWGRADSQGPFPAATFAVSWAGSSAPVLPCLFAIIRANFYWLWSKNQKWPNLLPRVRELLFQKKREEEDPSRVTGLCYLVDE